MENKYSLGKVYEIVCFETGKIYVGSTCEEFLSQRLANHRTAYKRYLNNHKNEIKQNYSTAFSVLEKGNFYINLLEKINASSKDELLMRERYHIKNLDCVNKCIPLRTSKEYYKDNIEEITAFKSVKCVCECGGKHRTDNKAHHAKTKKHINYINLKDNKIKENDLKEHKGVYIDLTTDEKILSYSFGNEFKGHNGPNMCALPLEKKPVIDMANNVLHICCKCQSVF